MDSQTENRSHSERRSRHHRGHPPVAAEWRKRPVRDCGNIHGSGRICPPTSPGGTRRGDADRLFGCSFHVIFAAGRFCLVGAAQVVLREIVGLRDLGGRPGKRVAGRIIVPLNALIADQGRGGSRGEPAILVDPVRISVPALSGSGMIGHGPRLPAAGRPVTAGAQARHAGLKTTGLGPLAPKRSAHGNTHPVLVH
jgi:hypothetical protein